MWGHLYSTSTRKRPLAGAVSICERDLNELDSALDEETRQETYDLLKRVQRQTGVTTLHVTHSRAEARALAERLLVLDAGSVQEVAVHSLAAS